MLVNAARSGEALKLLQEGIGIVPPEKSLFSLYEAAADILVERNEFEAAIRLLHEGTQRIAPEYHLTVLYQKLGLIYCRAGKPKDAILSQIQGYRTTSSAPNGYKLAEGALFYCAGTGDLKTINALLDATDSAALTGPQKTLGKILEAQLLGNWPASTDSARKARNIFPRYAHFAALEALGCLAMGNNPSALKAITSFPNFKIGRGLTHTWLLALTQMRMGKKDEAAITLGAYLDRPIDKRHELNEAYLLRLWYQQATGPESHNLCFRLPVLPARLTGLTRDVRRTPFASAAHNDSNPVVELSAVQPIKQYGDYIVESVLGKGGAGEVFKAKHKESGAVVALKVMQNPGKRADDATFRRELESLMRLSEACVDGVLMLLDFIRENDQTVLVLEFADGGNLDTYVTTKESKKLSVTELKAISESLIETMIAVHAKQIIHRDLKPANLLLVGNKWKIADFGLAKYLARENTIYTLQGGGTPGYAAPEQIARMEAKDSADIFSFGKIMLFMATGTPDPEGLGAISDNALRRLIKSCIEHNPNERPVSMEEVKDHLKYVGAS